ncbi:MAG TPA: hypothetical protein VD886_24930 [Herpetosiphonaceae bacterium]|nr:hypothetical protein [Herpetosiphonaceae bacterium]
MDQPTITYDEFTDTLSVEFDHGPEATSIALNEHMALKLNVVQRRAYGLILADYSLLVSQTRCGPRAFPLRGLNELDADLRALALDLLGADPVRQIVSLGVYTPSLVDTMPIISVREIYALKDTQGAARLAA